MQPNFLVQPREMNGTKWRGERKGKKGGYSPPPSHVQHKRRKSTQRRRKLEDCDERIAGRGFVVYHTVAVALLPIGVRFVWKCGEQREVIGATLCKEETISIKG